MRNYRKFNKVEEVDRYLLHDICNRLDSRMYTVVGVEVKDGEIWLTCVEQESGFEISSPADWYLRNATFKGRPFGVELNRENG